MTSDANQMNNEMRLKDFETSAFPLSLRLQVICHTLSITAHSRASFVSVLFSPTDLPTNTPRSKILRNTPRRCDSEPALALSTQCALEKGNRAEKCTKSRSLVTAPNHAYKNLRFVWHEKTAQLPAMHLGRLGEACLGGRCKCADLSESHLPAKKRTIIAAHVLPRH